MLSTHNNDPTCIITGSSTHNEHIEQLWRDVYRSVSNNFVEVFTALENEVVLDTLNEVDVLFILCFLATYKAVFC